MQSDKSMLHAFGKQPIKTTMKACVFQATKYILKVQKLGSTRSMTVVITKIHTATARTSTCISTVQRKTPNMTSKSSTIHLVILKKFLPLDMFCGRWWNCNCRSASISILLWAQRQRPYKRAIQYFCPC